MMLKFLQTAVSCVGQASHLTGHVMVVGLVGAAVRAVVEYHKVENQIKRNMDAGVKTIKSHDIYYTLEVSKRAKRIVEKLDFNDLLEALDADGEVDVDDQSTLSAWRAAYKWSRQARIHMNYPSYSEANRISACDYLKKEMAKTDMRLSQVEAILPLSIVLTFVRSIKEIEADKLFELFQGAGRVKQAGCK